MTSPELISNSETAEETPITHQPIGNRWIITLLLLAALTLRLAGIQAQSFSVDEGIAWLTAQFPLRDIVPYMTKSSEVHPPLYFYMLHIWMLLGTKEWILRLSSVVFALLNIALTYLLARRIADEKTARWALFLIAASSFHMTYSQELRMYPLLTFFFLLSFVIFFEWLEKKSLRLLIILCLVNTAALYTHYFAFFIVAVESAYILITFNKNKSILIVHIAAQAITAVLYIPWILHYLANNRGQDLSLRTAPGLSSIVDLLSQIFWGPHLPPHYLHIGASRISIYIFAGVIVAALLTAAINYLSKDLRIFLGLYLFLPLITVVALSRYTAIRIFEFKYFLVITPALFIILGNMLSVARRRALPVALAALFLAINLFSWWNYNCDDRYGPQNWKVANYILQFNCHKNDAIVVHPSMMASCVYYYYRGGATIIPFDNGSREELEATLRPYQQIWICTTPFHPFVERTGLLRWFDLTYHEVNYALFPAKTFVPSNVIMLKGYEKKKP
jgi:mannosyltransferase